MNTLEAQSTGRYLELSISWSWVCYLVLKIKKVINKLLFGYRRGPHSEAYTLG
jgi:hypothetical protein